MRGLGGKIGHNNSPSFLVERIKDRGVRTGRQQNMSMRRFEDALDGIRRLLQHPKVQAAEGIRLIDTKLSGSTDPPMKKSLSGDGPPMKDGLNGDGPPMKDGLNGNHGPPMKDSVGFSSYHPVVRVYSPSTIMSAGFSSYHPVESTVYNPSIIMNKQTEPTHNYHTQHHTSQHHAHTHVDAQV